jgi:6-phosphogluconolactonase
MKYFLMLALTFFSLQTIAQDKKFYLAVGTYTKGRGNGNGIYVYEFNSQNGSLKAVDSIATENPSYLTFSSNGKYVYAVNQNGAAKPNEVSAFSFNKHTGALTFINKQQNGGEAPCYITVDKKNKWLFTANYTAGNLSVLGINKDGSLSTLKQLIQHTGSSIVKDRQASAHVHTVVLAPNEEYLFATDLGTDKISKYQFNSKATTTPLTAGNDSVINVDAGSGPRHIAFSPNQKNMYVVNELSGVINAYAYKKGVTNLIQTISTDTSNRANKGSADIHLSYDGKFLYATNRGNDNNIAVYSVNAENGKLSFIHLYPTLGKTPRNFMIDPTDNYLLVANQNTDNIVVFKRDKQTGALSTTGIEIKVGSPVCLQMMEKE